MSPQWKDRIIERVSVFYETHQAKACAKGYEKELASAKHRNASRTLLDDFGSALRDQRKAEL